jgi:flavin-dependent dehydrogenase
MEMGEKGYDVIIIGAGPSGTSTGRTLSEGGLKALIIESKKLPRHKMCTSLLSKWTVSFVNRHFGVIPERAYADNPYLKGIALHFPSLSRPLLLPTTDPAPLARRDNFDFFLAERCGAEIKDGLQMTDIERDSNGFKVTCRLRNEGGGPSKDVFHSKYLVAADGSNSRCVRQLMPESIIGVPRVSSVQVNVDGKVGLDCDFFHGFFVSDA